MKDINDRFDFSGIMPPLPRETAEQISSATHYKSAGSHTFTPCFITRNEYDTKILPELQKSLPDELVKFISSRVNKTFILRDKLKKLRKEIIQIVGEGNFSALWLDREAFSADSMEHRSLITEAVIHIYSASALQEIVKLFYENDIPMIPYGEGGGYNMGVTPMAPAVTISVRGIDHISEIRPSRRHKNRFEISVGAGVPFKDLVAYLSNRGYVLRCDPNTPRAATGGIAATGSNGGSKAFEVVMHGRAITGSGTAICFEASPEETDYIEKEPFLIARKFFSITDTGSLQNICNIIQKQKVPACVIPNADGIVIPLIGSKAKANQLAQKAMGTKTSVDSMAGTPKIPISAFIGAEGTTGFIYEVTFEIEKPLPFLQASRWHLSEVNHAVLMTRAIKDLPKDEQPTYFEFISGQSIRRYLMEDYPNVFSQKDEAVIILSVEGKSLEDCRDKHSRLREIAQTAIINSGIDLEKSILKVDTTNVLEQSKDIGEFETLRKPRETLPKKLRTKCKTDMEIRREYLKDVLQIVENTKPQSDQFQKIDVLFGHLTPNHTAIIHWNIGGFDLYNEDQADIAWDYLEKVIGKAQSLAPENDPSGSARFTGEHGLAGKAPFLWLNYISEEEFSRMMKVKDILDPKNLFNPETIFLKTSYSRMLRARLLAISTEELKKQKTEHFILEEALKCTRCNSCKICPVIDAEHELERENKRNSKISVLPSKRNILMFLERTVIMNQSVKSDSEKETKQKLNHFSRDMLQEGAELLSKCFYCRRCDKACPVDIEIHPLTRAYHELGKLPAQGSKFWGFIYNRLMGEDFFKTLTYRLLKTFLFLVAPANYLFRKIKFLPDWIQSYTVPPTLSFTHYQPLQNGYKLQNKDNFVFIDNFKEKKYTSDLNRVPEKVFIRYRGCMDTFGIPEATTTTDAYFKEILNCRIVDLEKKMCCGFPFEADGLHERAKLSQRLSMVEIVKCISRLYEEGNYAKENKPEFILFSNCPTCCEAVKEMGELLKDPDEVGLIFSKAKLDPRFTSDMFMFSVQDTVEIAMYIHKKLNIPAPVNEKIDKTVGLKVPCHNTTTATKAQMDLLRLYYKNVVPYERCCGLSGTGRLKHPRIGTKISEKLYEEIREKPSSTVVSGCPSCRDGVKMQRDILAGRGDDISDFKIAGIFQQIQKDIQNGNDRYPR